MTPRPRPPRVRGVRHFFAALGYSLAGARRLWRETAVRHEAAGGAAMLLALLLLGASAAQLVAFGALFAVLVAVEAINTAIEIIADRLSPEWSEFARDAKDLGSFAAACIMVAHGLLLALVAWKAFS